MKQLLTQMFNGWILRERSWNATTEAYDRTEDECFIEACGGDVIRGGLVSLFTYWSNDIESLAPHYGIAFMRDSENKPYIKEDVPPAPSIEHYWRDGEWIAPSIENDETAPGSAS